MRKVILESPFAPSESFTVSDNEAYARQAVRDALLRGEAPLASHLLYTQPGILLDTVPEERRHGIDAGHAWLEDADAMVVYTDQGISSGMHTGIARAEAAGLDVEYRSLGAVPTDEAVADAGESEVDVPMERGMAGYLSVNSGRSWPSLVTRCVLVVVLIGFVLAATGPLLHDIWPGWPIFPDGVQNYQAPPERP